VYTLSIVVRQGWRGSAGQKPNTARTNLLRSPHLHKSTSIILYSSVFLCFATHNDSTATRPSVYWLGGDNAPTHCCAMSIVSNVSLHDTYGAGAGVGSPGNGSTVTVGTGRGVGGAGVGGRVLKTRLWQGVRGTGSTATLVNLADLNVLFGVLPPTNTCDGVNSHTPENKKITFWKKGTCLLLF